MYCIIMNHDQQYSNRNHNFKTINFELCSLVSVIHFTFKLCSILVTYIINHKFKIQLENVASNGLMINNSSGNHSIVKL